MGYDVTNHVIYSSRIPEARNVTFLFIQDRKNYIFVNLVHVMIFYFSCVPTISQPKGR